MTTPRRPPGDRPVVALDVGGTHVKAAVLTADGTPLHTESADTRAERGPDAVLETILALAGGLARRFRPAAVGIAVPGIVDEASGVCRYSANLGWRDVPVRRWAEEELGLPVAVGHDVRAGGIAEARLGAGRGCRSFLFVPVGTGIAGAVLLNGRALLGGHGGAGEVGHLVVRPDGPPCACGARGCVEAIASASAIARRYRQLTGLPPQQQVSAEQVQQRARAGDAVAARVWREAVAALADGLLAAVTLLDPQRVVIGGGLSRAGAALLDPLRAALAERLTFQAAPELVPAELGHRAGSLGAGLLALDLLERTAADRADLVGAGERE
ncbi:ROK family protein [Kitasatospora viridis]|uniref:Glucokinase n=1 Tax=Kitasatospora viridis TaxID=281105 RepID=A0A561SEM5_9ACTN|nr:ROK family protein [Kitasatospora viridis]TWF73314.1 glucokinase [Kitasatospora viridis]